MRMHGEICYDLVMEQEMSFVEGTHRLPGHDWQVFIFSRWRVEQPRVTVTQWHTGATGVFVRFPEYAMLNKAAVEQVLARALGVEGWVEVSGPDSMQLR